MSESHSLADWLAFREPFDTAARSMALTQAIADVLPLDRPVRILDLGTGTGSNLRFLARHLPVNQQWLLVDKDASVLAELARRMSAPTASDVDPDAAAFETRQLDLGRRDAPDIFADRDLVTASALLDLVSVPFLEWVAERCRAAGAAALFTLTYTGRSTCEPAEPEDDRVCALLNQHQQQKTDKGFGPAVGPEAVACAERAFVGVGYRVRREPSDWQIGPDAQALQRLLIQGWADAAFEMAPAESVSTADWLARRLAHVDAKRSHITVSHEDLAAFPPSLGGRDERATADKPFARAT